jgi:hypothetical protein
MMGRRRALLAALVLVGSAAAGTGWAPAPALAAGSPFQPTVTYDVGAQARTVGIADVTGDGRADVLLMTSGYTGSENDDKLFVFAQRADGTLAPPVRYGTDDVAIAFFAVLDANGDGRQDVAAPCRAPEPSQREACRSPATWTATVTAIWCSPSTPASPC